MSPLPGPRKGARGGAHPATFLTTFPFWETFAFLVRQEYPGQSAWAERLGQLCVNRLGLKVLS